MFHTTWTQNFEPDLIYLVILDDLDMMQGHKRLRRVLRCIPDTIRAVPSALSQFDMAALPGEASNDRFSKIWHLTRLVTSSVMFKHNFATYSEGWSPEISNAFFGSRIGPLVQQITGGKLPNGGQGPGIPRRSSGYNDCYCIKVVWSIRGYPFLKVYTYSEGQLLVYILIRAEDKIFYGWTIQCAGNP